MYWFAGHIEQGWQKPAEPPVHPTRLELLGQSPQSAQEPGDDPPQAIEMNLPSAQESTPLHDSQKVCPVNRWYVPEAQGLHSVAPVSVVYLPAGHATHGAMSPPSKAK